MTAANIMIVEDEYIIAMETKSNLVGLGYNVTSIVDSGDKVINSIKENMPDLILMDIQIKGDLDGIEVAKLIRSDHSLSVPLIFLSAYAEDEKLERAKLVYPSGYLVKPVQERELKASIEMALHSGKLAAQREKHLNELHGFFIESKSNCEEACDLRDALQVFTEKYR